MSDSLKKVRVEVHVDCDTDRLYGSIGQAIKYLKEVQEQYKGYDISLFEHWTGYEDMEMKFVYFRDETNEEMNRRIEERKRQQELEKEWAQKEEDRKKRLEQYEKLKREFG